jgi:hypothetical protein
LLYFPVATLPNPPGIVKTVYTIIIPKKYHTVCPHILLCARTQ